MVGIKTYRDYWNDIVSRIAGLKSAHLVANEAQLKNKIANIDDYPILVATIPSSGSSTSKDEDNTADNNLGLIFILKKVAAGDRTDESYVDDMQLMQDVTQEVRDLMEVDKVDCEATYHALMERLDVSSFNQDPEYNYLGHDGWSLSFKFADL